jgi:hypothetical protein
MTVSSLKLESIPWLTVADELARFADQVLVLENGAKISSLEPSSNWLNSKTGSFRRVSKEDTETPVFPTSTKIEVAKRQRIPEEIDEKIKRQVGDYAVWVYYVKSIGALHCLTMLLFTTIAVFAANFPRKCSTV